MNRDWVDKDFYKILGVSDDSDSDSIKKAYRKLAQKYHPDANPGDSAAEESSKRSLRPTPPSPTLSSARNTTRYAVSPRRAASPASGPLQAAALVVSRCVSKISPISWAVSVGLVISSDSARGTGAVHPRDPTSKPI